MLVSNIIEQFILDMFSADGQAEIQRNELAQQFSCAPSQINYVITTRFTTQRGYSVESRRGGGGYIRITRASVPKQSVLRLIGGSASFEQGEGLIFRMLKSEMITAKEAKMMLWAISDRALKAAHPHENEVRAEILKAMINANSNE